MTNPGWLDDFFAGVMMAVAGYSAGRLVLSRVWSRPTHRDIDVAHVLMGTAMAGMLVAELDPLPIGGWEVVFSLLAAWYRPTWPDRTEGGHDGNDHHLRQSDVRLRPVHV